MRDGHCSLTNLPWRVDQEQLARRLGCPVQLVNDLVALADGVPDLRAEDQVEIQPGGARTDRAGLLIAVGTGLGVSILTPLTDGTRTALPSEGGHVELAARDALEARVVETMRNRRGGRCDAEALLSGSGLPDLYECLLPESIALGCLESEAITRSVRAGGAAALFTAATSGDGLANFVVERWLSWLGAQIGDYALTALPLGGIYLAGGVLRKNVEWLRRPGFRAGFLAKAHFRDQLAGIPIRIITSPDAALCGAARRARRLATTSPVVPGEPA